MRKALKSWQTVSDEVETLVDRRNDPIDEGIKPLVIALRCLGINTVFSCYGHNDRPHAAPWIDIIQHDFTEKMLKTIHNSQKSLQELLEENNDIAERRRENYVALSDVIGILNDFYSLHTSSMDEYLVAIPWDDYGVFRLECQGSRLQEFRSEAERAERLSAYQAEMDSLAAYLKGHIVK